MPTCASAGTPTRSAPKISPPAEIGAANASRQGTPYPASSATSPAAAVTSRPSSKQRSTARGGPSGCRAMKPLAAA